MAFIEVEHLSKTYTLRKKRPGHLFLRDRVEVRALEDVSFTVRQGELIGYIGPNGAGKSTTVKLLSGIMTPDGGSVRVGGIVPWEERKRHVARIGVVFGQRTQLWWDVPVSESYELLRKIYRIDSEAYKRRRAELTEALDLGGFIDTPLRQLSLGQRMRAELAGSLLHSPEILFLDEPTIGLDAVSKLQLREFLKRENREHRTTILLTTHDMDDVAALCSRVTVLGHGRLLYDGVLEQLLAKYDTVRTVHIRYTDPRSTPVLPGSCTAVRENEGWKVVYQQSRADTDQILHKLQDAGEIREMTIEPRGLDDMIAELYREMAL